MFSKLLNFYIVKLPQQELETSFGYKQKTSLSPSSGCRYISRQESGVLYGSIIIPGAD